MIRVGVIGLGNMGGLHADMFLEKKIQGAILTAVCDVDPKRLEKYSNIKKFTDSQEFIQSGAFDAIVIATPHFNHTTAGIESLNQGLHVLVEKPISVHKADCERLIAAHTNKNQVFAAMFNLRTDPHYKAIKKFIEAGDLGKIHRTNYIITDVYRTEAYFKSGSWRGTWRGEGGGVLTNQCPHNLDLFQWICGMPKIIRGFCSMGKYHDIEVEDEVISYIEYENGATGIFMCSTGEAPGTNRLEIAGDNGKLLYENDRVLFLKNEIPASIFNKTTKESFGKPNVKEFTIETGRNTNQHLEILQNFINAIVNGEPLIAPAEEGIHSVELGNAMLFSSITVRPVTLPLDSDAYAMMLNKLISKSNYDNDEKLKAMA